MTTEYLIERELEHVLAALTPANELVCRVCLATGLRVGDVVALRTNQLRPQFWLTEAKTGKRRRVNLRRDLLRQLQAQAGKIWCFEGARDPAHHRTRQAVWADVKRAAKAFRLRPNVAPHSLRKIYAAEQLDKSGGDVQRVRRALNHDDEATTMIYLMARQLYEARYPDGRVRAPRARRAGEKGGGSIGTAPRHCKGTSPPKNASQARCHGKRTT